MALSTERVRLFDYEAEADKRLKTFGITNRHTTHSPALNSYLGGGYGSVDNWEIVVLFGETGIGKSTVAMNLIAKEAILGTKIAYMLLEDDPADFFNRLKSVVGAKGLEVLRQQDSITLMPESMLEEMWKLDQVLEWIRLQAKFGVEIVVIDHLQFVFENDIDESSRSEFHKQRKFMRQLNFMLKKLKITVILVSHVNKNHHSRGMDKIIGASAIAQAGTKVIGVYEVKGSDDIELFMHKARNVKRRIEPITMARVNHKFVANGEDKYNDIV